MKWCIQYSAQAKEDLQSIYEYVSGELLEPDTAVSLMRTIMEEISTLNDMPLRYRLFESEPWASKGVRIFPVGKYIVLYQPEENRLAVNIIRIMYGGRDIAKQLDDLPQPNESI